MSHSLIQLLPGLLSTRSEFPFGSGPTARALFIVQASSKPSNFALYGSSHISDYTQEIADIGGIQKQLLGHRDEASKYNNVLPAPVWCHEFEKQAVEVKGCKISNTFSSSKHIFLKDDEGNEIFTAYHTPGHTNGSTSYLWQNIQEGFSVLFVGDAIGVTSKQGDINAYLQFHPYGSNLQDEIKSLDLMMKLKPTYIVPALSMVEDNFIWKFQDLHFQKLYDELNAEK